MSLLRGLVLTFSLAASSPSWGWGNTGHRICGEIAQSRISGKTAAEIEMILGKQGLAEMATWPDEQRSNPESFWQKDANPWHYVTLPDGKQPSEMVSPAEGDALTALERFASITRDRQKPRNERALALRFVIHIIGDLHQPLHVGNGNDRGGNDTKVTWFGEQSNLHSVWDSGMVDRQGLSFTEYSRRLEQRLSAEQTVSWWDARPQTWIAESAAIRTGLYPPAGEQPVALGYKYQFEHLPTVETRLLQSGVRVAAYLDTLFK
jgi:S1/P1 Nuclease